MMTSTRILLIVAITLVVGNCLYQFSKDEQDWFQAFERSYFQIIALGIFGVVNFFLRDEL